MKKYYSLAMAFIVLTACIPRTAFQPSQPSFMAYEKLNATDADIKAQMLDCGYLNPFYPKLNETLNERAQQQICMLNAGYRFKSGYQGICHAYKDWQSLPACIKYRSM